MSYMRPPRMYYPRFGCLGFLLIGWIFYLVAAFILSLWFFGLICATFIQLFLWSMTITNRYNRRRKRRKMTKKYRVSSPTWRR